MGNSLIVTSWNTVVYTDKLGSLRHGPFFQVPHNVWITDQHILKTYLGFEQKVDLVLSRNKGKVGIAIKGIYYSAEHDGMVSLRKNQPNDWEQFRLLTPTEAISYFHGNAPSFLTDDAYVKIENSLFNEEFPFFWVLPKKLPSSEITPNIHQISLSGFTNGLPISDATAQNIAELKNNNPGWDHHLWTNENVIDAIFQWYGREYVELFYRINPKYGAARADFFRYLCVYALGGVYLDLKSTIQVPLNTILQPDDQFLLSHWPSHSSPNYKGYGLHRELKNIPGGEYEQWHVVAAKGHPFLERIILDVAFNIRYYNRPRYGVGNLGTLRVTGPIAYTLAIEKIRSQHPHRIFSSHDSGFIYKRDNKPSLTYFPRYNYLDEDVVMW